MPEAARPRLLVVDDEVAICELVRQVAGAVGFDVDTASEAADIERLLGGGHDITILDLNLSDDDGVSAMRTLSQRAPGSAVIVASGAPERVLGSASRVAGMYGLRVLGSIPKPLSVPAMQQLLRDAMEAGSPSRPPALTREQVAERAAGVSIDDVRLAYQPIIDLRTGEVVSAETASRWTTAGGDAVGPSEFVPAIERAGQSAQLLEHVARQAAADRREHAALRDLPTVAINMSARDLDSLELPAMLNDVLTAAAPADRWTLEITETATTSAPERALDVMTRLSLMQFRLSIDDFGTGTSNLERLRWYPFSELKIDRSYVVDDGPAGDWIILRNTLAMAQQLGLVVVAEGVEDTRMLRRLRDLGCDRAQGYLISAPVEAGGFAERCAAWAQMSAALY